MIQEILCALFILYFVRYFRRVVERKMMPTLFENIDRKFYPPRVLYQKTIRRKNKSERNFLRYA